MISRRNFRVRAGQLLVFTTLLYGLGCVETLAPIDLGSKACESNADCSAGLFCFGDPGEKRCLRNSAPRCGDAVINDVDACDDGNSVDEDGCTNECRLAFCGDGISRQGLSVGELSYEACDDGNRDDSDACTSACRLARCGDGIVRAGEAEACDDGNENLFDSCTVNCALARCGDGFRRRDLPNDDMAFEGCDDGNLEPGDGCSERCQLEVCGNAIIDHGEACDDGNGLDHDACRNDCQLAHCGDGIVRQGLVAQEPAYEACDDANDNDDDLCSSACLWNFGLIELPIQTHHNYAIGSFPEEDGHTPEEHRHNVQFSRRFALGRSEVTQEQYAAIMGANPSATGGLSHPVEQVYWTDAILFANAASLANGLLPCYQVSNSLVTQPLGVNCAGYRLPTESEWEVAARANQDFRYAGGNNLGPLAWFKDNSGGMTHEVAGLAPNAWGLFDMTGNVKEWTWDAPGDYSSEDLIDPMGLERVELIDAIVRGGSWYSNGTQSRVAYRLPFRVNERAPEIGFRLARTLFDAP